MIVNMSNSLPLILQSTVQRHWEAFTESAKRVEVGGVVPTDALTRVWAGSDFVARACVRDPGLLAELIESKDLYRRYEINECRAKLDEALDGCCDERELARILRGFRRREMVRIAWRDLVGEAPLDEVLFALSDLADACTDAALTVLHRWQRDEWGVPVDGEGRCQTMVVLGMGKLGAHELNFSSDIDLIFAYPEDGHIVGPKVKTNAEYFIRLARRLIKVIDEKTADGFVFRVDMRLRPFGESGPLVMNFSQMEAYYTSQGREWERYALIKARPIAGDPESGAELISMLKPFVYRRYLDYGTFEQLREMKAMIAREVARRRLRDNIKLGPGGIREVEFIGQAFQLVRGGRESRLQQRSILGVLQVLAELGLITPQTRDELSDAYVFLRRTENRLQAYADMQSQTLPDDEVGRVRLAFTMGYDDWASFRTDLEAHQRNVQQHFQAVFGDDCDQQSNDTGLQAVWSGKLDGASATSVLGTIGIEDPDTAIQQLGLLRESRTYRALSAVARDRLDRLVPLLLQTLSKLPPGSGALTRMLALIERIAGRSVYLSLLIESPLVLEHLVRLVDASPWLASYVTRHPIVLDELLDPRNLYEPVERGEIEADLEHRLAVCAPGETECEMDALRHCKHAHVLRIAATDVMGVTPLMKVSDYLTDIAEVCMSAILSLARRDIAKKHGLPHCVEDGVSREPGMAVIAYGKLGGWELGYGSDLDVVFLHDSAGDHQESDGKRALDNNTWFARVGQRIVHYLTTLTAAGELYETDMRLRPNGNSGMMVTAMTAFVTYQRESAWIWEHQALVRARFIAGDVELQHQFEQIRHEILTRPRDIDALRAEVRDMRNKMYEQLGSKSTDEFDLKQDRGGIADIEFLVQFAVLSQARAHPALTRWTDNIRILDTLTTEGLMPAEDARLLADAYRAYRARGHRLVLQEKPARVPGDEFQEFRTAVQGIWHDWMGSNSSAG